MIRLKTTALEPKKNIPSAELNGMVAVTQISRFRVLSPLGGQAVELEKQVFSGLQLTV